MNFWKDNFKELFLVLFLTAICIAFGVGTGLWFPPILLIIVFWGTFLWLAWEWLCDYVMLLYLKEIEKENKAYLSKQENTQEETETDEPPPLEDGLIDWGNVEYKK